MSSEVTRTRPEAEYAIGQGTSNLFDLDLSSKAIQVWINNPGHLAMSVRIMTSFAYADGATVESLSKFAKEIEVTCSSGKEKRDVLQLEIKNSASSPFLEFGTGPGGGYSNGIHIETKSGESLHCVIERTLNIEGRGGYDVLLVPVLADLRTEKGHHGHVKQLLPKTESEFAGQESHTADMDRPRKKGRN